MFTDRAIFKQKRVEQTHAAESILELGDYSKQYKMVEIVLEKLFKVYIKTLWSLNVPYKGSWVLQIVHVCSLISIFIHAWKN